MFLTKQKRFILSLILPILGLYPLIPQTIVYEYDQCGNRIKREVTVIKRQNLDRGTAGSEDNISTEGEIKVWLSYDALHVTVSNLRPGESFSWEIYYTDGRLVKRGTCSEQFLDVDISAYPMGVYAVSISLSNERYGAKVLKK